MNLIPARIHTYVGLVVGVALVVAPWLFGFGDTDAPRWSAIGVGLFIIVSELVTTSPASPVKVVPMRIHVGLDVLTGIFLAATPWIFSFSDLDLNAWLPHVVVGVAIVLYAVVTDTTDARSGTQRATASDVR